MKQTRLLMGMPITVEVVDTAVAADLVEKVFSYFTSVDQKFSTYKKTSEISLINKGEISLDNFSRDMKKIFVLAEETKQQTKGYFDILHNGVFDPSGIVKGWAIQNAAAILEKAGAKNFFIEAGGDIQVLGKNGEGNFWRVGIRNPFNAQENIKVVFLTTEGIATSGTSTRGQHIYNPHSSNEEITKIKSMTVIGPSVYDADRFATAAFAMGEKGIAFIENFSGVEGYMIDYKGIATMTSGFERYTKEK